MKKILLPFVIVSVVLFTACNSKKETSQREMVLLTDSMYKSNLGSDTAAIVAQPQPEPAAPVVAAPIVRTKKPVPHKSNTTYNQPVNNNNTTTPPVVVNNPSTPPAPAPSTTGTTGTGTTAGTTDTKAAEAKKKEGISKAAQGAIIGGVGGAVVGAVIGKGGKGAILGGVIGAAGGYILGRKKDKASGRVTTNDTIKTGN